jgi:predicted nucleic acid-binding Zn ribbon protein
MSKKFKIEESIPKHKHCIICGAAISVDKEFCSEKCEEQYNKMVKRRKYSLWIMMLIFPAMFLILLLLSPRR